MQWIFPEEWMQIVEVERKTGFGANIASSCSKAIFGGKSMLNLKQLGGVAMLFGMLVAATPASGQSLTSSAAGATAFPGGVAYPELSFSMSGGYSIADFTLHIDYDFSKLSFDRAASTVSLNGAAAMSLDQFESMANLTFTTAPGQYNLNGIPVSPIPATSLVIKGAFAVLPGVIPPTTASVQFSGQIADALAFPPDDFDHTVNVSVVAAPVPEPESWAMLLAGLGVIGATVRRRRGARAS